LATQDVADVVASAVPILVLDVASTAATSSGQAFGLIGADLVFGLRCRLYHHIQALSLDFFTRSQSGALVNRIHNDVREAQSLV
jgi:ATP-binding cassette subfamily B protein